MAGKITITKDLKISLFSHQPSQFIITAKKNNHSSQKVLLQCREYSSSSDPCLKKDMVGSKWANHLPPHTHKKIPLFSQNCSTGEREKKEDKNERASKFSPIFPLESST